jgi:uncharacterized membrane protein
MSGIGVGAIDWSFHSADGKFRIPWAPMIPGTEHWALFAIIAMGTAVAIWLEGKYRWAEKVSAPVLALLMAMVLSNLGVVPTDEDTPAYGFVGTWLVPLALPLLLMQANVIRIARETGRLFLAVHFSTIGTMVAAFAAVALLAEHPAPTPAGPPNGQLAAAEVRKERIPEPEKSAAIMTASYVGGMVNFTAVRETVKAKGSTVTTLLVADNLVMAGFFVILLWMAGSPFFLRHYAHPHIDSASAGKSEEEDEESQKPMTVNKLAWAMAYAAGAVAVAMGLSQACAQLFPSDLATDAPLHFVKDLVTNRFVVITLVSLVGATFFPGVLKQLHGTERIGSYLLYLYLFTIGLPADLVKVIVDSPMLFVFCAIMAMGNLVGTMVLGKLFRVPLEPLLLSINATLGGPPTAAAMAASRGWPKLVLPGLLAGLWGYVIGTPVGLLVYKLMVK